MTDLEHTAQVIRHHQIMVVRYFASAFELVLLILGVTLPLAHMKELWIFKTEFSLVGLSKDLFAGNEYILSVLVITFGFIFPLFKIIIRHTKWRALHNMNLHKFSMVDIFLMSFLVFSGKASMFFNIHLGVGFYCLLGSILLGYLQVFMDGAKQAPN